MTATTQNDSPSSVSNGWAVEDVISRIQQLHLTHEETTSTSQLPPFHRTVETQDKTSRCNYI